MNTVSGCCELHGDRLARAIGFINRHFNQPLSLEDIAQAAYLSRFHFARAFRLATGESPMSRLRRVRIERAMDLMIRGELTLSEIASEVGFCDQSHFTRHFRRVTGTTPGQFMTRESRARFMAMPFWDVRLKPDPQERTSNRPDAVPLS